MAKDELGMVGGSVNVQYLQATVFFPVLHTVNYCNNP
jgi:hypothetical protein